MLHVAFYFEDWTQHVGVPEPKASIHRWSHNMKTLGVDKIWMIDNTTFKIGKYYQHNDSDIEFERADSLEDIEDKLINFNKVYLEVLDATPDSVGSTPLTDFGAPSGDTLYVVGRDTASIEYSDDRKGPDCHWVHIPMEKNFSYYAETAMAIALFHRMSQINNG